MLPNPSTTLTRRVVRRSSVATGRSAFTLIELLVVVSIIAVLMTLIVGVVGSFLTQAKDAATKTTINKIQGLLNSRAQAFDRLVQRNGFLSGSTEYTQTSTQQIANGDANLQAIIAKKLLQVKFFPQNVSDLKNSYLNATMLSALYPKLYSGGVPTQLATNPEIFYDFLTQENVLGGVPVGSDAFSASEIQDTDGDGLPQFIDAWGNPIRFYRWPTRLFRSGGQTGANTVAPVNATDAANAKILFSTLPVFTQNLGPDPNTTLYPSATSAMYNTDLDRDPDDPLRSCLLSVSKFESSFHTPITFHVFLVMSAGPDGILGLYEPDDTANFGHLAQPIPGQQDALADNIISLNIRAGGK